jgi:glycolate oxidase iron-sulfur subunit
MAQVLGHSMPGDLPVIVNSAGCGSFLKEQGGQLSARIFDIAEFLAKEGFAERLAKSPGFQAEPPTTLPVRATYHDACHLAHGQRIREAPRTLLSAIPGLDLIELEEADRCCGSAGIYNLTQPEMARALLERKWANVEQTSAMWVVMGNPGCHAWLDQASREHGGQVRVLHTAEMLEASFSGLEGLANRESRSGVR